MAHASHVPAPEGINRLTKAHIVAASIVAIIYASFLLAGLPDYGLTWDESLYFSSSLSYVRYFQGQPLTVGSISNSANYGPAVDILATYSYFIFSKSLGWTDPITAHRIPIALLMAGAVLCMYIFLARYFNQFIAVVSAFALALYPVLFAHSHFNAKDVPVAALFTISVVLFFEATYRKKWWLSLLSGAVLGFSFATKFNAIFVPVVMAIWYAIAFRHELWKEGKVILPKRWDLAVSGAVAVAFTILCWPWLWFDTWNHLLGIFKHFATVAKGFSVFYFGQGYVSGQNVPWSYPYGYLVAVTPLLILVLALIGIGVCVGMSRKKNPGVKESTAILLLVWFFVTTGKVAVSGMVYDNIRQFFEAIPALAAFVGLGAWFIVKLANHFLKNSLSRKQVVAGIAIALFLLYIPTLTTMARLHPYESSYFSELVGGTQGAAGKFRISYWGDPMMNGILWLNSYAPQGGTVNVLEAPHLAMYYLRPDLKLVQGDGGDFIVTFNYFPQARPLHSELADGVPILNVYQGNPEANFTYFDIDTQIGDIFFKEELGKILILQTFQTSQKASP